MAVTLKEAQEFARVTTPHVSRRERRKLQHSHSNLFCKKGYRNGKKIKK